MQLWPFISHSGFLLESRFSDFFKFAIFSTKISLFLQIHFNLLEDKHSFGYFWTPKSTYDICSVFLYMLSYTLSPKNSKIEILFCQTLRPECSVQSQTAKWQKIPKDHVVNYVNSRFRCIEQNWQVSKIISFSQSTFRKKEMKSIFWRNEVVLNWHDILIWFINSPVLYEFS